MIGYGGLGHVQGSAPEDHGLLECLRRIGDDSDVASEVDGLSDGDVALQCEIGVEVGGAGPADTLRTDVDEGASVGDSLESSSEHRSADGSGLDVDLRI